MPPCDNERLASKTNEGKGDGSSLLLSKIEANTMNRFELNQLYTEESLDNTTSTIVSTFIGKQNTKGSASGVGTMKNNRKKKNDADNAPEHASMNKAHCKWKLIRS